MSNRPQIEKIICDSCGGDAELCKCQSRYRIEALEAALRSARKELCDIQGTVLQWRWSLPVRQTINISSVDLMRIADDIMKELHSIDALLKALHVK